jgi:tyrosinase
MTKIAESFQKEQHRNLYRKAVKKFRLPYWDYYKPRGGEFSVPGLKSNGKTSFPFDYRLPDIFTRENVTLRTVENQNELTSVPNPLKSFKFPPKESGVDIWSRKMVDTETKKPITRQVGIFSPRPTIRR